MPATSAPQASNALVSQTSSEPSSAIAPPPPPPPPPPSIPEVKAETNNLTPLTTPQLSHTQLSTPQISTMQTPISQQQIENQHQDFQHDNYHHESYQHDHHGFDVQPTHHFHALGVNTGQHYPGEINDHQYSNEIHHYSDDNGPEYTGLDLDPNDLKTMNPLDSFANMI
jgi:hypothetical protein